MVKMWCPEEECIKLCEQGQREHAAELMRAECGMELQMIESDRRNAELEYNAGMYDECDEDYAE